MNILITMLKKCRRFREFLDEELVEEVLFLVTQKTSYYFPKVFADGIKIADYIETIEPYSREIIIKLAGAVHFSIYIKVSYVIKLEKIQKQCVQILL